MSRHERKRLSNAAAAAVDGPLVGESTGAPQSLLPVEKLRRVCFALLRDGLEIDFL